MKTLFDIPLEDSPDIRKVSLVCLLTENFRDIKNLHEDCFHDYSPCGNWYQDYHYVLPVFLHRLLAKLNIYILKVFEYQNL